MLGSDLQPAVVPPHAPVLPNDPLFLNAQHFLAVSGPALIPPVQVLIVGRLHRVLIVQIREEHLLQQRVGLCHVLAGVGAYVRSP